MSFRARKLAPFIGIFLLAIFGWNCLAWYKGSLLSKMAAPYFQACKTRAGCILAPEGWTPDGTGGYYKGRYDYRATTDRFTLRQHLATDVWLVAEGGKGMPVRTRRDVD